MHKACLLAVSIACMGLPAAQADCPDCRQGTSHHGGLHSSDARTATMGPRGSRPRTAFMYRYTEWYGIHYTPPLNYRLQADYPWHTPAQGNPYAGPRHVIEPRFPAPPAIEEIAPPGAVEHPYLEDEVLPSPAARAPRRTLLR